MGIATVYLLITSSAFFWGANFVLAGPVLADLPPLWAAALRFALGAMLMFLLTRVRREEILGPARRHAGAYLLLGVVGIAGFNLFFFFAMAITSATSAALIMATNPLLTTILAAAVSGERPTARHLLALPVALIGVAVVIVQGGAGGLASLHVGRGDLLMLGANVSWALYNVLGRRYMPTGSPVVNTTWIMVAGAGLLAAIALGSGEHVAALDLKAGSALAAMVVGGTVLAYLFWSIGIVRLGAARTAIFLNLVPVFAMLISTAAGTPPTAAQLAGGLLVLVGVAISMLPVRQPAMA
jgi:drug/metabolite transporter (DMT)-like permease